MKIKIKYEQNSQTTFIDVPDNECELWVEQDYQRRLQEAENKETVKRRTAQQIMDEECNNPTVKNDRAETRRHVSYDALDPEGEMIAGASGVEALFIDEFEELHEAISKLTKKQRETLYKVFWLNMKQVEIARAENVGQDTVSVRLKRAYAKLAELLEQTK